MTREEFLRRLPELARNYRAAPEVLQKIQRLKLLIIIGPSGVGKTTIINALGLPYVPSDNSRPRRPEEREGVDYFFRQDYERVIKEIKTGKFVQVAIDSGGDLKATRASSYPESGMATMAVVADVVPYFRDLGFGQTVSIFITPPSYEEWMRRLDVHDLSEEHKNKRLAEASRSFSFALNDKQTHFILNDNISDAANQINDLVAGKIDNGREAAARQAAEGCLDKLNYS